MQRDLNRFFKQIDDDWFSSGAFIGETRLNFPLFERLVYFMPLRSLYHFNLSIENENYLQWEGLCHPISEKPIPVGK